MTDLSKIHEPVGDLITLPSADQWRQYQLTDDQVAFYAEQGYLAGIPILDDRQVEQLRNELARLLVIR